MSDDPLANAIARALEAQCAGPPRELESKLLALAGRPRRHDTIALVLAAIVAVVVAVAIMVRDRGGEAPQVSVDRARESIGGDSPAPRKPTGTLDLRATPPAHVWIDGKQMHDTPLHLELPVGSYELDIVWDGGKRTDGGFKIHANQTTELAFDR